MCWVERSVLVHFGAFWNIMEPFGTVFDRILTRSFGVQKGSKWFLKWLNDLILFFYGGFDFFVILDFSVGFSKHEPFSGLQGFSKGFPTQVSLVFSF